MCGSCDNPAILQPENLANFSDTLD